MILAKVQYSFVSLFVVITAIGIGVLFQTSWQKMERKSHGINHSVSKDKFSRALFAWPRNSSSADTCIWGGLLGSCFFHFVSICFGTFDWNGKRPEELFLCLSPGLCLVLIFGAPPFGFWARSPNFLEGV